MVQCSSSTLADIDRVVVIPLACRSLSLCVPSTSMLLGLYCINYRLLINMLLCQQILPVRIVKRCVNLIQLFLFYSIYDIIIHCMYYIVLI